MRNAFIPSLSSTKVFPLSRGRLHHRIIHSQIPLLGRLRWMLYNIQPFASNKNAKNDDRNTSTASWCLFLTTKGSVRTFTQNIKTIEEFNIASSSKYFSGGLSNKEQQNQNCRFHHCILGSVNKKTWHADTGLLNGGCTIDVSGKEGRYHDTKRGRGHVQQLLLVVRQFKACQEQRRCRGAL